MTSGLVCFPGRGNWFAEEHWVRPEHVAALTPGPHALPNNTEIKLSAGGSIYLWDYPIAETAMMLGFELNQECPHGHSGVRCDECYATAIAGEAQRGETVKQGSTGTASTRADRHRPNSVGHLLHKRSD